jgi:hypothetical protein
MTKSVCPFVIRHLSDEHLPLHFIKLIEMETARQHELLRKKRKRALQVDFNKMYGWSSPTSSSAYKTMMNVVMNRMKVNPILEQDIARNNTSTVIIMARREYEYQKQQVKTGKRKHIQVDLNVLYY